MVIQKFALSLQKINNIKCKIMATTAAKATKEASAGQSSSAPVRKGRLTDFWEKYPEGVATIIDRRAVLK
ncbi:hypothetical protein AGMMS4957_13500 [Bacteroidia bacterium]|nr:hypothetical protein AGMMS4957_13500 [Bacteroidia bacterium]